jgi:hypothetical protein
MRRKLPLTDNPDWRDPNMPVYRNYRMPNDTCKVYVDPDYEHRYREHMFHNAAQPNWRSDPTYNLKRRK